MPRMIRHAKSLANGSAAIARGNPNAPLSEEGLRQCPELKGKIVPLLGGKAIETVKANVSELWRTHETAQRVGFEILQCLPLLNESVDAAPLAVLSGRLKEGWLPPDTLKRAETFLSNPDLWQEFNFSHGLFIASCRYVAGERPPDGNMRRLVPFYAEMIDIPT